MEKLTRLFHKHLENHIVSQDPPSTINESEFIAGFEPSSISEQDLYYFRKQRGVNLGSWFVLERWIAEAPFRFAAAPGQSDLDVARGSYAKHVLERHWDTWITENDLALLAQRGVNTVRIPIGYYHLCGIEKSVIQNTEFSDFFTVFEGAWTRIVRAITCAQHLGMGVLIDLHAAPGKQNGDSHSGSSSNPTFFSNSYNLKHTIHILRVLVGSLLQLRRSTSQPLNNIVGVELLNEPQPNSHEALQRWYKDAINQLRSLDSGIPLYIGECWMTDQYADFVQSISNAHSMIILDHHLYRCFTSTDISTSVTKHTHSLTDPNASTPQMFARAAEKLASSGGAMIVGEWSCGLNPGSLQGLANERQEKENYISAQLSLYEKHCAGWFFWTYKKEQGDVGWSFRDAIEEGICPNHFGLVIRRDFRGDENGTSERMKAAKDAALGQHTSYWAQYPGHYEHWRFSFGFIRGWQTAYAFLTFAPIGGSLSVMELGFKGGWAKRAAEEHIRSFGRSDSIWEFQHAFNQGADSAKEDFQRMYC